MKRKRVVTVILLVLMILSSLTSWISVFGENSGTVDEETLTKREVYLHAQKSNPIGVSPSSTVIKNEPFNLYFSIDNPNKGAYNDTEDDATVKAFVEAQVAEKREEILPVAEKRADDEGITEPLEREKFIDEYLAPILLLEANRAEQVIRHTEARYDLNGYSVRIYYDANYFKLQEGVDKDAPIDYTIPDKSLAETDSSSNADNNTGGNLSDKAGYSAYVEGAGYDSKKGMNYAEVTVFLYGSFLPQEKGDIYGDKWYDLCALPLVPTKAGTTKVSIEMDGDSSKNSLVLFSKHENNEQYKKEFEFSAINGGEHTINIVNSIRPDAPVASPLPAGYVKGTKVTLGCGNITCTQENENHDIYYCIDGTSNFLKYEGEEFIFNQTSVIYCYAVNKNDALQENKSEIVSFKYVVLPDKPILFTDVAGKPITNVYTSDNPFSVYCDTEEVYDNIIGDDTNIYYTFSDMHAEENTYADGKFITNGNNPKKTWVKAEKSIGLRIDINETVQVKLVTVRENQSGQEISEVSTYLLGIKPGEVSATPPSGANPVEVGLSAEDGCDIYYTTDGSSPIENGIKYSSEIPVKKDTIIRAVAKKDGIFGNVSDFSYTVTNPAGSVITSNYPNGEYEDKIQVLLSSDNPADKILYSTDGGITWNTYTGEKIDVETSADILAKVDGSDEIFEFSYIIKPLPPVFAPNSTYFSHSDYVTVYCQETVNDGMGENNQHLYTVYYTLDGSDPRTNPNAENTKNSPVNTVKIPINEKVTIKAAVKTIDGTWSDVVTNTYDVISYKLAPPVPTLKAGQYYADKMYTAFFEEQDGCETYYTISYGDSYVKDPQISDKAPNNHYIKGSAIELGGRMIIKAVNFNKDLNLKSDVAVYEYIITPKSEPTESCYADKESGIYEISPKNEDFDVNLYSRDANDVIECKIDGGNWEIYDPLHPVRIEDDCILYVRGKDGVITSYVYEFIPKPPVSTLNSGRYLLTEPPYQVTIKLPEGYSSDDYYLFFRDNKQNIDSLANGDSTYAFDILSSVSYKAYVVDKTTGKRSKNALFYYIVESDDIASGNVFTIAPYKVKSNDTKYIASHLLSEDEYNEGIKLETKSTGVKIKYRYTYTKTDGTTGGTDYQFYLKSNPIMVTSSMADLKIEASLTDLAGNDILGTEAVFNYKFESILVPQFTLSNFTIKNDYEGDDDYIIYYTIDGSNPLDETNPSRVLYDGGIINLKGDTTVKTVYYKACDEIDCPCNSGDKTLCENYVYGKVGTFKYKPQSSGMSSLGGTGSKNNNNSARRYTKDFFGNEHITHISYIKGYPDGSVKPEGNITREEVTAILYRMRDKKYDKPFSSTGTVFSDVNSDRWSVTDIEFMASENVVLGYPDGEFKPVKHLTRAEFAALIYRFCRLNESDEENKFTDLSSDHWAYDEIMSLLSKGLIQGYEDRTFKPEKDITRAEVITVVNKILGRKPLPSYVKSLDFNPFNDLETEKWYYTDVLEATVTHDYLLDSIDYEYKWENWK